MADPTDDDDYPHCGLIPAKRPAHYKVICISIYTTALAELDLKVEQIKAAGHTKFNRSQLIRLAIASLTTEQLVAMLPRHR